MANGSIGMSGHNFDAFVSSQRTFNDYDLAAKIQEKYWRARQKFLAKIEKKEDTCIVLSDSKLDSKIEIYRSIDSSCSKLTNILESYQNALYIYANEENSLGTLLKECSKHDKTKAGKIMAMASKSLTHSSHQTIKLYMPLLRIYQEMSTFQSHAVEDTSTTVKRLESKRSQYRASLLWMKDLSERLDPDIYKQLDKFRRVQNQVRLDKKAFDSLQMDVVQKIDLLMASRCNLMNQILAAYQTTLLETFEKNYQNFKSIEELIKKEDIYEYEFKALKQLNPLKLDDEQDVSEERDIEPAQEAELISTGSDDLLASSTTSTDINKIENKTLNLVSEALIDLSIGTETQPTQQEEVKASKQIDLMGDFKEEEEQEDELEKFFGNVAASTSQSNDENKKDEPKLDIFEELGMKKNDQPPEELPELITDLLNMMDEQQPVADLLGPNC